MREFPDGDLSRVADAIVRAAEEFTSAAEGRPVGDRAHVSNGMTLTVPVMTLTVPVMTALLLGEEVIHGLDITRTAGLPWTIIPRTRSSCWPPR